MIPQDLQYDYPFAAYFIVVIFLFLFLFGFLHLYKQGILLKFAKRPSLKRLITPQPRFNYWSKAIALCLVWIFACLALMQPKGDAHYIDATGERKKDKPIKTLKKRKPHDVIFLVDVSASMAVPDGRYGTTRLHEAQEIVDQIAARLGGEQAALYTFTSEVTQQSPPTMDTLFMRMMAQQMRINEGGAAGTDITKALKSMYELFLGKETPALKTIIMLSDGGDTRIESLSGLRKKQAIEQLLEYVKAPDPRKGRIFTIGLGTEKGGDVPGLSQTVLSRLDDSLLKTISSKGRGKYYAANQLSVIDIAEDIIETLNEEDPYYQAGEEGFVSAAKSEQVVYNHYYQIPLAIALLLLLAVILIPDTAGKIVVLLALALPVYGSDLHEAHQWWEAGAYERAIEIYEEMLEQNLTPYEESVVRFNLGTVLLDDGQTDRAVFMFRSIPLDVASPLLKRRLNTNTVVARLREEIKTEDLPKKVFLLREAMKAIFEGETYHCELAEIIQSPQCFPAPNLKEMRAFIENDLSTALTDIQKYQIADANFIEGIPLLLSYVQSMLNDLRFLQTKAVTPELEESYKKLFLTIAESWTPLWSQLKDRPHPPQRFVNANQYNRYALILLRNGDYDKSREHFEAIEELLIDLIRSDGIDTPEQEALIQLARSYQLALLQEPVQEVTLKALIQEQKRIKTDALKAANDALTAATKLVGSGKPEEARIQLEVAQQEVRNILRRQLGELSPVTVLEASIEIQEHALSLARLVDQTGDQSGKSSLKAAQKEVVKTALPFFQEVIEFQKWEYAEEGKCQRQPWEATVPHFYHGLQAARAAVSHEDKIPWQELALTSWKKALEEMKQEEEEEELEKQEEEIDTVIRDLRQMQQDDLLPQPEIVPSTREARPW